MLHLTQMEFARNHRFRPQIVRNLLARIHDSDATLNEIAELIRKDGALSSRVLKTVNSSYYAIPGGVCDIRKALQYLSVTTLEEILLTIPPSLLDDRENRI